MARQATRSRMIEAASKRFYRDGFRDVGLDQILSDVGISKTAFYKHFSSKEDLMLAVIEAQDHWLQNHFQSMVDQRGGSDPRARLLAVFDVVDDIVNLDEFRGCFFVKVAMEFPLQHDPAHRAAAKNKRAMFDVVEKLSQQAGADDPETLAKQLMVLMEGAFVTRHVTGDHDAISIARQVGELLVDRSLTTSRTTSSD